jgi:hypothetical protein
MRRSLTDIPYRPLVGTLTGEAGTGFPSIGPKHVAVEYSHYATTHRGVSGR